MKSLSMALERALHTTTAWPLLLASFVLIIFVRVSIESALDHFSKFSGVFLFYEFTHTLLFFGLTFLALTFFLAWLWRAPLRGVFSVLLFGALLTWLPPLIDYSVARWLYPDMLLWSYYLFDSLPNLISHYFTFFGDRPDNGITYGTRAVIALVLLLITAATVLRRRDALATIGAFVGTYTIFFIGASMPSIITLLHYGTTHNYTPVDSTDVAQLFLTPHNLLGIPIAHIPSVLNIKMSILYALAAFVVACYLLYQQHRRIFLATFSNLRVPQVLYHGGLLTIGAGLALLFTETYIDIHLFSVVALLLLFCAVGSAWYATVVCNDLYDQTIDRISAPHRPLTSGTVTAREHTTIGMIATFTALFLGALVHVKVFLLLLLYLTLATLYNMPPLRLKRFPLLATLTAACASLSIVMIGFIIVAPEQSTLLFPPQIFLLLLITYTICLPIKDLKDLDGDRADHVYTLPVLLGARYARIVIGMCFMVAFVLSVFFLNEPRLWPAALTAGTLCYLLITWHRNDAPLCSPQRLLLWIFAVVCCYGLFMTITLFF